jgi:preprotein translocase subunit Sec63
MESPVNVLLSFGHRETFRSHPDKVKLAGNQTREDADAKFVELTKAYKA